MASEFYISLRRTLRFSRSLAHSFAQPFVVGIVAYTFFGLDALGDEIEEPFGNSPNDLALDAICRTIEINLREAVGEDHGLEPLKPVNYCLM